MHPASRRYRTALRHYAFLRTVSRILCSPGSPCVKHGWKGAATLQTRALHAIGTASNSPTALAIESAPYSPPVDVLTVWSAPVNRVQSGCICGQMFSMSMELQRLSSMHPRGLGKAWTWEAQKTLKRSRRSVDRSSSSSAPRGTCVLHALRGAQC